MERHPLFPDIGRKERYFMIYDIEASGMRIKKLREKQGMTQENLAEQINMSRKTISAIENGRKGTTIDTLVLLAEKLETSLDYLVLGRLADSGSPSVPCNVA